GGAGTDQIGREVLVDRSQNRNDLIIGQWSDSQLCRPMSRTPAIAVAGAGSAMRRRSMPDLHIGISGAGSNAWPVCQAAQDGPPSADRQQGCDRLYTAFRLDPNGRMRIWRGVTRPSRPTPCRAKAAQPEPWNEVVLHAGRVFARAPYRCQ